MFYSCLSLDHPLICIFALNGRIIELVALTVLVCLRPH